MNACCLKGLGLLAFWFVLFAEVSGQTLEKQEKHNMLEIYFPVCHFFDGTNTNWTLLVPAMNYSKNPPEKHYVLPFTFGLAYSRKIKKHGIINASIKLYAIYYYDLEGRSKMPGETIERSNSIFSLNYLYPLTIDRRILLRGIIGLEFRYGAELYHVSYPNWFEQRVESRDLADLGPSIGLKLTKTLRWNFHIGTEAKYTRFLYRRDKGKAYYPFDNGSSPNLLTLQLNVGYRF